MIEITLIAIPNQSFSIRLGDSTYDIRIHACKNIMSFDIIRDNTTIVSGERAVPNYPLIPYKYLQDGNFILETSEADYPDYTQFGVTQFLYYVTQEEIGALRAGT